MVYFCDSEDRTILMVNMDNYEYSFKCDDYMVLPIEYRQKIIHAEPSNRIEGEKHDT